MYHMFVCVELYLIVNMGKNIDMMQRLANMITHRNDVFTYVLLRSPPRQLPIRSKNCWEKKTQVIC